MGLPRQNTLMSCPSAIGDRSTSIGAPAAIVEASGFIWEINGQAVNTVPTAAAAPVATKRKSRRVGWSAEDAIVTIPKPFLVAQAWLPKFAAGGTARKSASGKPGRGAPKTSPEEPAGARDPRGGRRTGPPAKAAKQAVQNRSIGTLAGRAQAR